MDITISGPPKSGKSRLLQHIATFLTECGCRFTVEGRPATTGQEGTEGYDFGLINLRTLSDPKSSTESKALIPLDLVEWFAVPDASSSFSNHKMALVGLIIDVIVKHFNGDPTVVQIGAGLRAFEVLAGMPAFTAGSLASMERSTLLVGPTAVPVFLMCGKQLADVVRLSSAVDYVDIRIVWDKKPA